MATPALHVTDLEERLAGPQGPALQLALIQKLKAIEALYRRQAAGGPDRADFLLCEAAATAAACAITVLARYPASANVPSAKTLLH
ncbi:hypothetical protein ACOTCB_28295 [Achromobacter xylosoxidans]